MMMMMIMHIVVGVLGMVPKVWEKRLEELENRERIGSLQTTVLLRSARIEESWRT